MNADAAGEIRTELETVRSIVRRWGWNGTSYQILNPGFTFWLDSEHDAAAGYVERYRVRVVGGAPICADDRFDAVVQSFESDAAAAGCGVAYFGAEQRIADLARTDARRVTFPIGAQPVWTPSSLVREFETHASLRAQLSRARNKRVTTRTVEKIDPALAAALRSCLDEWMSRRGLPPLHFLIETETLENLVDRRVVIAECAGRIVGFLLATPIPARSGWLIEQLVRCSAAPNGTVEALLHHAARMLDDQGAVMLTLGLAPLARRGAPIVNRSPSWTRAFLAALRSHGRRFYNFEGLEQFKSKFAGSSWDPVYLSLAPGTRLPRTLLAVTAAFSGEALWRFVPRMLLRRITRAS